MREDIALVPVIDVDPREVVLVTRADDPYPLLGPPQGVARASLGTTSRGENGEPSVN
ncbi:hypothetical protein AB0M11_27550 [Streptomyces sp. NPDC051987]|uniref:hypothetical protein n=1 Tax=Streptomyces sp. NPDC051987 TaxID=3155808 RepID=UPI0034150DBC